MFVSVAPRNFRQIIQQTKPIYRKHHDPIKESLCISSSFSTGNRGGNMVQAKKLTNFEKRILVYNKNYPTMEEVPESVSLTALNKAKDWSRVRISFWMIGATIIGCGIMSYIGREQAKRGDGLQKQNLEWHKQYNQHAKQVADAETEVTATAAAAKS